MMDLPFNENKLKTLKIAETETEKEAARGLPYLEVIGSLLYACITHPECSYVVSLLCKMMKAPTVEAYECALNVLEYMVQHKDEGICYTREISIPGCFDGYDEKIKKNYGFVGFSDASWSAVNPFYEDHPFALQQPPP